MNLKGHSGCSTEIRKDFGIFTKTSTDKNYFKRLYNQYIKQLSEYNKLDPYGYFSIPEPLEFIQKKNLAEFIMQYVPGDCYIDFLLNSTYDDINNFTENLCDYIINEISTSKLTEYSKTKLLEKYYDVVDKIEHNCYITINNDMKCLLSKCEKVFLSLPEVLYLPTGRCHGDFTLTNMLFYNNKVYLIDFLDSFIESPIIDVVKLRQDTYFKWGKFMCDKENKYNTDELDSVLERMDTDIVDTFNEYEWYKDYYTPFQILNLLRILQYAKIDSIINYLINNIKELINY